MEKRGFTLSEILISLTIIGVVAALTIPGLIKNHNEKAWATASNLFSQKLEVALRVMNTDGTLTGYPSTLDFVNALKKNIKITKICSDDVRKCFAKEIIWNSSGTPIEIDNTVVKYREASERDWAETVGVQFANGVNALIAYDKNCIADPFNNQYAVTAACVGVLYDVSGFRAPNTNGKDIYASANIASLDDSLGCAYGFKVDGEKVCFSKFLSTFDGGFSKLTGEECPKAIAAGEIDVDACDYYNGRYNNDYYAGAVKACGGKKANLPSPEQLAKLAMYLYDYKGNLGATQSIEAEEGYKLDAEKAANYVMKDIHGAEADYFIVWTSKENSATTATTRDFHQSFSNAGDRTSRSSNPHIAALCLGD